ncbi:MAG: LytTR family DNA-binding domain-containing protein [Paludibacteraceae bacterium]|nr:response regulator transcription factor [Bacteroidia bacterium]
MIKAVIIEDEPVYAEMVQSLSGEFYPGIEIRGYAQTVETAALLLASAQPDIAFCDIELKDGTMFDVLKKMNSISFQIIFITAHNKFAIQAFKFSAIDYLLKPVEETEFRNAVDRAIERVNQKQLQHIRLMLENMDRSNENRRIVLRTMDQIHIVNVKDIVRCRADNTYTTFYLVTGENILVSKGMKEYEDILCENGFFKIHQSHIINLQFLRKIDKSSEEVILSDKTRLPLSQRRKQDLLQILNES